MISTDLIPVELQEEIRREVATIVDGSASIERIDNHNQFENAVALTREIKRAAKKLDDTRKDSVGPLNGKVKAINDWFREPLARLDAVEKNLKKVIQEFQAEQERKRIEEQRKADEAARKERERIEAEARAQREREEANRRAEEEARRRALEAANAEERAKAQREAEAARKRAEDAAAKAKGKEQVAELVVAPVVHTGPVKASGMATVTNYKAEMVDMSAFVQYCLSSSSLHFLEADMRALDRIMAATKGEMQIPGVRCLKSESVRMRAAA